MTRVYCIVAGRVYFENIAVNCHETLLGAQESTLNQSILEQSILHCWGDSARLVSHLSRYRSGQAGGSRAGGSLAKITKDNKMF